MERSREVFCPISFNWNSHRIIFNSTRLPASVTGFGTASALLLPAKQLRSPWGPSAFLHPCLPSQGALFQLQLHLTWGVKLFQELENLPFTSPRERKWDSVKQGWRDGCSLLIIHCRAAGVGFNYCLPSAGRFRFHFGKWWTNPMRVSWSLGTVGWSTSISTANSKGPSPSHASSPGDFSMPLSIKEEWLHIPILSILLGDTYRKPVVAEIPLEGAAQLCWESSWASELLDLFAAQWELHRCYGLLLAAGQISWVYGPTFFFPSPQGDTNNKARWDGDCKAAEHSTLHPAEWELAVQLTGELFCPPQWPATAPNTEGLTHLQPP